MNENVEKKETKVGFWATLNGIFIIISYCVGAFTLYMSVSTWMLTKFKVITGKFRHNLAWMLGLITLDEKMDFERDEEDYLKD